ncbi:hypothetical protein BI364_09540 [Acidihalobacter yilgarnensis]|uniref:Uncharacterized protein n=1 Tax=Acidihalobacter yilgarnensis TaxID=2819280 RepID=A0A1D8INX1_9GAMM|nr:hypothetical protein BI364_09480 [Acidihalobacter yilgarnensis]AOU98166.1 hypothetical protein BI364_09540 [Acidihalobacter yilgarnensis]
MRNLLTGEYRKIPLLNATTLRGDYPSAATTLDTCKSLLHVSIFAFLWVAMTDWALRAYLS